MSNRSGFAGDRASRVGQPRVIFFGAGNTFSLLSLNALVRSGIKICATVLAAPPGRRSESPAIVRRERAPRKHIRIPMYGEPSEEEFEGDTGTPEYEVRRLADPLTTATLASYEPDLICVACFAHRLPRAVLDIPRLGCLNLHPSLLPGNRGVAPLFWALRFGYEQAGVTIHFMDENFDSGDIVAQEAFPVTEGMTYMKLEDHCAELGAQLLARSVWDVYEGRAQRIPQDEALSSYHSYPTAEDFIVPVAEWDAAHAYNFFRGIKIWGEAMKVRVDGEDIDIDGATNYTLNEPDIPPEYRGKNAFRPSKEGNLLWVRCKTGWVCVIAW